MELVQRLIGLNEQVEWTHQLSLVPHLHTHTHWYNQAMSIASNRDVYLYCASAPNFHAICPLSPRQKQQQDPADVTTPYGFSGFAVMGHYEGFAAQWSAFMRAQGFVCGHIALHPLQSAMHLFPQTDYFAGKNAYVLDLTLPIADIYQQFSDDHRHRLRQWQKKQYTVSTDKQQTTIDAFLAHYTVALKARNAAKVYDFGALAWQQLFAADAAYLFSVKVNEQIEAAALFIAYEGIVDYFMMASSDNGRVHARGIIWEAIQFFQKRGMRAMYLGCGVRENDALSEFKARFGGKSYPTFALKQVYFPNGYQALCAKYRSDASEFTGYFPSYWARTATELQETMEQ